MGLDVAFCTAFFLDDTTVHQYTLTVIRSINLPVQSSNRAVSLAPQLESAWTVMGSILFEVAENNLL